MLPLHSAFHNPRHARIFCNSPTMLGRCFYPAKYLTNRVSRSILHNTYSFAQCTALSSRYSCQVCIRALTLLWSRHSCFQIELYWTENIWDKRGTTESTNWSKPATLPSLLSPHPCYTLCGLGNSHVCSGQAAWGRLCGAHSWWNTWLTVNHRRISHLNTLS